MAWDNEKKKVKTAVAVAYEPGDKAPKILASGKGEVAEKIIAKAKENALSLSMKFRKYIRLSIQNFLIISMF